MAVMTGAGLVSCLDEPLLRDEEIGEGESNVRLELTSLPTADASLGKIRSAGDAIENIRNLFVAFYDQEGNLAQGTDGEPLTFYYDRSQLNISTPDRRPESQTEAQTEKATPKGGAIKVPYGRYYVYSVVNMGDLSLTHGQEIQKASTLRRISFDWNHRKEEVGKNDQMSGYFDTSLEKTLGENVSLVTINKHVVSLFSWVKRAASKVTVAFDAKNLNENIYIYLHSVQIKDIPNSCLLVDDNTPTDRKKELTPDGEIVYYSDSQDYEDWPCLAKGKGSNTYGSHENNNPNSLFFFENKQGKDPNQQKHLYQNFEEKDNFLCGTYVEVTGYYVNNSKDNPSYGPIKYRFMLGQNTYDDFNATRNTHYKLTLVFNRNANDPDWHIEFGYKPKPPQVVTHDVYISYLYNRSTDIPVRVYYDPQVTGEPTSVKAEIIKNPWEYDYDAEKGEERHKYSADDPKFVDDLWSWNKNMSFGFLTMERRTTTTINSSDHADSKTFTGASLKEEVDTIYDSSLKTINLPVYTRPLMIRATRSTQSGHFDNGYSGNNFYVGRTRTAQVRITATFEKGEPVDTVIDVIQVKRLVNPKGIWRQGNSTKQFRVTLKDSESSPEIAHEFKPFRSKGPWTARVDEGADWVRIKDVDSESWGTEVTGSTNSFIEFDYKPASTTSGVRFGRILVTYHDNTCDHVILVSQGFGTVDMPDVNGKTVKWHMSNMKHKGADVDNPLMQGSMFMYGGYIGIKPSNNVRFNFGVAPGDETFDCYTSTGGDLTQKYSDLRGRVSGFVHIDKGSVVTRPCNIDDWYEIYANPDRFSRYYGIMYGEECDSTLNTNTETNQYRDPGDKKGMRGLFIEDDMTANQLFFPIGTMGYGRRKIVDDNGFGVLRYANRCAEMPEATIRDLNAPNFVYIYSQFGALYWVDRFEYRRSQKEFGTDGKGILRPFFGFDINYTTFGFGLYETEVVYYKNDEGGYYTPGLSSWATTNGKPEGYVFNQLLDSSMDFVTDAAFVRLVDVAK